jgi:hypothetical protein
VDAAVADSDTLIELQEAEIEARRAELASRDVRIEELERVATRLSERVVEGERELRRLRIELARISEEGDARLATLTAALREVEDVRRAARGQATRIRLGALREAADLSERVGEISKQPRGMRGRMLEALNEAIARIGGDEPAGDDALEPAVEAGEANGHGAIAADAAGANGHRELGAGEAADLFDGLVELEIGPLSDFSQLVGFEDAAKSISATEEIAVKRFTDGRATLELSLAEPVALLRELEERCDLEFNIRDMRTDRVVLDVGD